MSSPSCRVTSDLDPSKGHEERADTLPYVTSEKGGAGPQGHRAGSWCKSQQTRDVQPLLVQCLATVSDGGPTFINPASDERLVFSGWSTLRACHAGAYRFVTISGFKNSVLWEASVTER